MKKILIIEDDETTRFIMLRILNKMNIVERVDYAANGQDGLDYLNASTEGPDLILLDIKMPILNGFEFLEEYQNLESGKKAKVILLMITSSLIDSDLNKANSFPDVKEHINKPISERRMREIATKYFQIAT
ncbi:MAG: response regulator [Flavobacteriales bacterium]|nr:response regulator [Flavobacteriales bacterium]